MKNLCYWDEKLQVLSGVGEPQYVNKVYKPQHLASSFYYYWYLVAEALALL